MLQRSGDWRYERLGVGEPRPSDPGCPVPFKANADRRHRIPRQRFEVTNWREYDASLRGRGSLTVWFTEEAIASWKAEPRTTRGVSNDIRNPPGGVTRNPSTPAILRLRPEPARVWL